MLSCVSMTLTVRMMRNAAALYVDVNVHLHLKVFIILMLGSPTDTLSIFIILNAKHLNLVRSTISSTWLFKIRINNICYTTLSKSKTVVHVL